MIAALVLAALQSPGEWTFAPPPPEAHLAPFQRRFVTDWLVIAPLDASGRRPFRPDAVFAKHVLDRAAPPPHEGETLRGELGKEAAWTKAATDAQGRLGGEIGWACATVASDADRVVIAKLTGAARMYVNGAGYVGDVYGYGFEGVPIVLAKGDNVVLVTGTRGELSLELYAIDAPIHVVRSDVTKPDAVAGTKAGAPIGAYAVTCFDATVAPLELVSASTGFGAASGARSEPDPAADPEPFAARSWTLRRLPALVPVQTAVSIETRDDVTGTTRTIESRLKLGCLDWLGAEIPLSIDVRGPEEARRVTFTSNVDRSVQFYALVPPKHRDARPPKLVLSLHGASVDAYSQARSYSQKDDFWIACPTNRRPYGFDWQDWGRRNVDEVAIRMTSLFEKLDLWHSSEMPPTYLTGHSMGGHGTWNVAANDPASYVAIAPSAGWCSFDTYGGRPNGALAELWQDADAQSRTLDLVTNLAQLPAFVLHGTADDNVPASEAHALIEALEKAGAKPRSHFENGAGHWWDGDRAAGADCVDWPEIFDLFEHTSPRPRSASVDFATVDPSVGARFDWCWIVQPQRYGKRARIRSSLEERGATLRVTTENVRRAYFERDVPDWSGGALVIDDVRLVPPPKGDLELLHDGSTWRFAPRDPAEKRPARSGPFKHAFDHGFVLVHGTRGTPAESREELERARCDLATWWYRANGTPELVADTQYVADRKRYFDRNVILYGNADTNAAWSVVLPANCPLRATRGAIRLGEREWKGDDLAAVLVYPQAPFEGAPRDLLAGAFADSGPAGARLGYTLAPFTSGVGYPDYAIFSHDVLATGDGGVLAAGWFDHAWRVDPAQYVRVETR